ncbi:haloalkane dehalogenase [Streptomyces nigrescens]|uniref:Haloalkane dehalogenase n=2 Tax=Streptomyces TaxID=1883 RepID=A0ABN6QW65_STRNI|nr:alpha/beta hydrolase [Streptomyces nigrescens]MEE4425028.1 alpha/beta hydrolase [Streptomyces sp. DSM 41528]BDM68876.1 haloalkane dehalogenase [Streptomyces nigrescens]
MATDATPAPAPFERLEIQVGPHTHDALACGPADGDLVLLLHGWPEFADSWSEVLPALGAAGYRAVAVDQRGYAPGARPPRIADYAVPELVADALAFADSQGAGRFHLVSHDWGGMVAWALAGAHPERLKSLSVLATPHPEALNRAAAEDPTQHHRLDYVRFFRRDDGAAEAALLADDAARLRAVYGGKVPEALVDGNVRRLSAPGALTATLNWYRAPETVISVPAGRIAVPTLFLWGSEDVALGRGAAESTGEWVDGPYRFEALQGASHWLPEEVPGLVTPAILDHLARHA